MNATSKREKLINWETAAVQPAIDGVPVILSVNNDNHEVWLVNQQWDQRLEGKVWREFARMMPSSANIDCVITDKAGIDKHKIEDELRVGRLPEHPVFHVYDWLTYNKSFDSRYEKIIEHIDLVPDAPVRVVPAIKVRSHCELLIAQRYFLEEGYTDVLLRQGRKGHVCALRSYELPRVERFVKGIFPVVDYKSGTIETESRLWLICETRRGEYFSVLAPRNLPIGCGNEVVGRKLLVLHPSLKEKETVPYLAVAVRFCDE